MIFLLVVYNRPNFCRIIRRLWEIWCETV